MSSQARRKDDDARHARDAEAAEAPGSGAPQVAPMDEHNKKLVEAVRPADWVNPQPAPRYQLVVVGAGTAGLVSAAIAAGLGAKVALVERKLMGGDCLNFGCVPSKGLIRAARSWAEARRSAEEFGGPRLLESHGRFGEAIERMRRIRAGIAPHDGAKRFSELGIDVFLGEARFVGRDTLEVGDATLRFGRAIVATGARAAMPPIPGLDEAGALTNETIFSLTELPGRLVVIGGGPIGLEMAQTFARFGSEVHLIDMAERLMPREDEDAAALVAEALERDGVTLHLGAQVKRVEREGDTRRVVIEDDGVSRIVSGDALLVAVGRKPNVESMGLEVAGVETSKAGIVVDERMRTSNRRVFAIGDVASRFKFTHAAEAQARLVVANALFRARSKASSLVVPWATYTSPELAHVGLYERDAKEAGVEIDTITVPLSGNDRALLDGEAGGFVRVHLARGSDRIVGASVVAEHGGEMIGEIANAMANKMGLLKLGRGIRPYPTQSEVMRRVADAWRKQSFTPFKQRLVRFVLNLLN